MSSLDGSANPLPVDVLLHPEQYGVSLPIEKIVADPKVDPDGVRRYEELLAAGERMRPIVVVKHPRKDLYSVVDGHHRFYAHVARGLAQVDCAVIHDFTGFMYSLTKDGWLQPPPAVTKHVHAPLLEFKAQLDRRVQRELRHNMLQFLADFLQYPEKLIERVRAYRRA